MIGLEKKISPKTFINKGNISFLKKKLNNNYRGYSFISLM